MKLLATFVLSVCLAGSAGLALAQNATPMASPEPGGPAMGMVKGEHPRIREIHERLQRQRSRIAAALKTGKLTKEEAKPLWQKIKSIREELVADVKSNNKTELTDQQYQQLNSELNANSEAIKDGQSEGGSSSAPAPSTPSAN